VAADQVLVGTDSLFQAAWCIGTYGLRLSATRQMLLSYIAPHSNIPTFPSIHSEKGGPTGALWVVQCASLWLIISGRIVPAGTTPHAPMPNALGNVKNEWRPRPRGNRGGTDQRRCAWEGGHWAETALRKDDSYAQQNTRRRRRRVDARLSVNAASTGWVWRRHDRWSRGWRERARGDFAGLTHCWRTSRRFQWASTDRHEPTLRVNHCHDGVSRSCARGPGPRVRRDISPQAIHIRGAAYARGGAVTGPSREPSPASLRNRSGQDRSP